MSLQPGTSYVHCDGVCSVLAAELKLVAVESVQPSATYTQQQSWSASLSKFSVLSEILQPFFGWLQVTPSLDVAEER